jgi:predicted nicotinamide N-methyase
VLRDFGTGALAQAGLALRRADVAITTFSETHPPIAPRTKLTSRAVDWATDALAHDDTTVSALARHLGVYWHTLWNAVRGEARRRTSQPDRLTGVRTLGATSTSGDPADTPPIVP